LTVVEIMIICMVTYTSLKTEEKNVSQYRLSTSFRK